MNQYDENDKKLIKLMEQLPDIEDKRPKDEIFRNVKYGLQKKKKRTRLIPVLSAIAAVLFLAIVIPLFFQQSGGNFMSMDSAKQENHLNSSEEKTEMSIQSKRSMDSNESELIQSSDSYEMVTSVYDTGQNADDIVTFGAVTTDGFVVPISMRVEDVKPDWLSTLKHTAASINLEASGFEEVSPLIKAMRYGEDSKTIDVEITDDNIAFFTKNEKQLMQMIEYTVQTQGIEIVKFVNDHHDPVELGAYGVLQDLIVKDISKKPYFLYEYENGGKYIIPADLASTNFTDALSDLKNVPNDFYQALIPEEVTLSSKEGENGGVIIQFKEVFILDKGDLHANIRMIEGILLTAKAFGYDTVKFENILPLHFDNFDFSNPISVPYSANLIYKEK
ncbi:hypothetical protein [Bacillus sp. FSL K6-3431]|uniref:hypothetical protein n=1 Tax=Bacillus sp. FSL K6-3431 TaxID=2921500 RepID=UPI0030F92C28